MEEKKNSDRGSVLYFKYEELRVLRSGCYRPSKEERSERMNLSPWENHGDRDCCTITVRGDNIKIVGSKEGEVTLREGDVLIYSWGKVGVIPSPEHYSDPVRQALARTHPNPRKPHVRLPQALLIESDEPITLNHSTHDILVCGQAAVQSVGSGNYRCVRGGDAVLRVETAEGFRRVTGVIVRSTADRKAVAEWLRREFAKIFPSSQDAAVKPKTLSEATIFAAYIAAKVSAGASPEFVFDDGHYKMEVSGNGNFVATISKAANGATVSVSIAEAHRSGLLRSWARKLGWRSRSTKTTTT